MGAVKGRTMNVHTCPLCNQFSSWKLTSLANHFSSVHSTTMQDVYDTLHGERPLCACGCGNETRWQGWTLGYSRVINGHNGKIYAVHGPDEALAIAKKRSESLTGQTSWSKGLTKDNDERISRRSETLSKTRKKLFEEEKIKIWNRGLTKNNDQRIEKNSVALREKYASGELSPWARGLTKEDPRIKKMATNVSLALRKESLRQRLDSIKRLGIDEIKSRIELNGKLQVVDGLEDYVNNATSIIAVRCNTCDSVSHGTLKQLTSGRCFKCVPTGSAAQDEIKRFIESLGVATKTNDRTQIGLELDVYVYEKKFAIEYNGLYWHSSANKTSIYHNNKSKRAAAAGISLLHVFEDEWRDKRSIVESMIRSRLGLSNVKVGARKCRIIKLKPKERRDFFNENHLDGDTSATVAWGLVHNDQIVYAISLRKPFHRKYSDSLEVARCCPKINYNVQGGLSKLVRSVIEHCSEIKIARIITYVDTRLGGVGSGYREAGFNFIRSTEPRWWWTDMENRFNRFKFKADRLTGRSESQVASDANVVKIWGCENNLYEVVI